MLNYHEIEEFQKHRYDEALRQAEIDRLLAFMRRPSALRRIVALIGNIMVGIGKRLQLEKPAEPVRPMLLVGNSAEPM